MSELYLRLTLALTLVAGAFLGACAVSDSGGEPVPTDDVSQSTDFGEPSSDTAPDDVPPAGEDAQGDAAPDAFSDTGASDAPSCVPQCGDRRCGPDPICGQSCGTCTAGTCDAGYCVNVGGPVIHEIEVTRTRLLEGQSVRVTAVVSDPDEDLLGGLFRDAGGATIAAFVAGGLGVFSLVLTWFDFHAHEPLEFSDSAQRSFAVEFFDAADNRTVRALALTFDCEGRTTCDGRCEDLESDPWHCGACDRRCGVRDFVTNYWAACVEGRCVLPYGCLSTLAPENEELTCAHCCESLGGTCSTACYSDGTVSRVFQFQDKCGGPSFPGELINWDTCGGGCDTPIVDSCASYEWVTCCCAGLDSGP